MDLSLAVGRVCSVSPASLHRISRANDHLCVTEKIQNENVVHHIGSEESVYRFHESKLIAANM